MVRGATAGLAPRGVPRQLRAIARRRAILDATLALLEHYGVDDITTGAIARRACVPVGTFYGYFPNKMAAIAELMREAMAETDSRLEGMLTTLTDRTALITAIDPAIDAIVEQYRRVPAHQRLFSAVRGNPALEPVMAASDARMTDALAETFMAMRPDLPKLRLRATAETVVRTFTALQQGVVTCNDPVMSVLLVAEWRSVIRAYLRPLAQG